MKERLIFFIKLVDNRCLKYPNLLDILVYLFKNRICEYLNINFFKNEESDKTSVDNTHTQGAYGEELINSPVVSVSHSLTTDAEYIFVSSNIITIFNII